MTYESNARNNSLWVLSLCLGTIFMYLYKDVFSSLIQSWTNVPAYSHGFIIPFVSLYILWEYRHKISSATISPNILLGTFIVGSACILLIFGKAGSVNVVQQISLLIMVSGLIFLLLGNQYMRAMLVPVGYLALMFPVFDGVIRQVQWPFQLLSARMVVEILQHIGIPVLLRENYIELPGAILEVARACSGIQYMVSIIAVVILLMVLFVKKTWARVLLFSFALVIGITVNWLRIVLISLWAYYGGEMLHGPGHILQGLFISVSGFVLLLAVAVVLRKLSSSETSKGLEAPLKKYVTTGKVEVKKVMTAWLVAFSLLACTAVYYHDFSIEPVPLSKEISGFPAHLIEWNSCVDGGYISPIFKLKSPDVVLSRVYCNTGGDKVMLYLGYFESQHQGKEIVHSDMLDLYDKSTVVDINIGLSHSLAVNKTTVEKNGIKYMSIYWYVINGRLVSNNALAKMYSAMDSLLYKRSNGAFVGAYYEIGNGGNQKTMTENFHDFVREISPYLMEYFGENKKIFL